MDVGQEGTYIPYVETVDVGTFPAREARTHTEELTKLHEVQAVGPNRQRREAPLDPNVFKERRQPMHSTDPE